MKISIKDITSLSNQTNKMDGNCDLSVFSYLGDEFSIKHVEPFDVRLSMMGSGRLNISFDSVVVITGQCNRCLSDVEFSVPVSCDETIAISEGEVVTDPDIGPYSFVCDEGIDVDELILSEILVNFPAKILCQDGCKGLCPTCGINLNTASCNCNNTVLDPRMAQFLDVFNSFKEV